MSVADDSITVLIGTTVRIRTKPGLGFRSVNPETGEETLGNPTSVTAYQLKPSTPTTEDDITSSVIALTEDGAYYLDIDIDEAGLWKVRIIGTGVGPQLADIATELFINAKRTDFTTI